MINIEELGYTIDLLPDENSCLVLPDPLARAGMVQRETGNPNIMPPHYRS